jgi:hypothetical protein
MTSSSNELVPYVHYLIIKGKGILDSVLGVEDGSHVVVPGTGVDMFGAHFQ